MSLKPEDPRKYGTTTVYNGVEMRSRLEAKWAGALDKLGIKWEYEPKRFKFDENTMYIPDFYLPEIKTWLEVKGVVTGVDLYKMRKLNEATEDTVVLGLANGFQVMMADGSLEDSEYCAIRKCEACGKYAFYPQKRTATHYKSPCCGGSPLFRLCSGDEPVFKRVYQKAKLELFDKMLKATMFGNWEDLGVFLKGEAAWLPLTAEEWDTVNVLMDDFPSMQYFIPDLDVHGAWVLIPDKWEEDGKYYLSLMTRNGRIDTQWAAILTLYENIYRNGDYNTIKME